MLYQPQYTAPPYQPQPLQRTTPQTSARPETAQAEVGFAGTATTTKTALAQAANASLGFGATCQAVKITTATAQCSVGLQGKATAAKSTAATAQATVGIKTTGQLLKSQSAQAVASVGVQAQCSSGQKVGLARAQASLGLRATALGHKVTSTAGGARIIWVDGRLALRLSSVIYERL